MGESKLPRKPSNVVKGMFPVKTAEDLELDKVAVSKLLNKELSERKSPNDPTSWNGRLNIYTCEKCKGHTITRDVDDGVTPFMLQCGQIHTHNKKQGCNGYMQSSMYRVWDQSMQEDGQWYKPASLDEVPNHSKDHVSRGGLMLREVKP